MGPLPGAEDKGPGLHALHVRPHGGRRDQKYRTLSAGVVVVRPHGGGFRYLLLRAYQYWDFPKGMVEADEEPLAAAIREVEEESTLTDLRFRWGERYRETPPYRRGKVARYYVAESVAGEVELPVNEELGRAEHDEFRWVDYDQAWRLLSPRVQPIRRRTPGVNARGERRRPGTAPDHGEAGSFTSR